MVIPILVFALSQAGNPGHTLPIATSAPVLRYFVCLFQPVERMSVPRAVSERERMAAGIIEGCARIRSEAAVEVRRSFGETDRSSSDRSAAAEAMFTHFERYLRFIIVENERFVSTVEAD